MFSGDLDMIRHLRADPAPAFCRVGRAVKIGGTCLAFSCLVVGAAFAIFVQASVEERMTGLLLFGLMPALGFYVGGYILYRTLVLTCMLCEFTVELGFRRIPAAACIAARHFGSDMSVDPGRRSISHQSSDRLLELPPLDFGRKGHSRKTAWAQTVTLVWSWPSAGCFGWRLSGDIWMWVVFRIDVAFAPSSETS